MRQVVNGAKGGPLLGHSSCMSVVKSDEEIDFQQHEDDSEDSHHDHHLDLPISTSKFKGPRLQIEKERRLRREIANSNERRRMQSINQGYMSLKGMLPVTDGGEKLSKAAVLQNAADYMVQILEERKQLMIRNAELTQAINTQRQLGDGLLPHKRRKHDVTESSDEGISMCYQSPVAASHESEIVIEELKRTVADLRLQLERHDSERRLLLEQSYRYSFMAAQASAQQPTNSPHLHPHIAADTTNVDTTQQQQQLEMMTAVAPLSPPQSRHTSTEEPTATKDTATLTTLGRYQHTTEDGYDITADAYNHQPDATFVNHAPLAAHAPQTFGKASSVASQNLSIIVEAINHLEGDRQPLSSIEKEIDSGVSHGESSDDTKSESSDTPQPPPAHQTPAVMSVSHHRPRAMSADSSTASLYTGSIQQHQHSPTYAVTAAVPTPATTPVPLIYRPTFLSNYISSQSHQHHPMHINYIAGTQRHHSL